MEGTIWTYPWDLADEGLSLALSRINENGGLNSISLAVSYHAGRFLLPHNPKRKVYFPEDGTIYFRPSLKKYQKIIPVENSLINEIDVLRKIENEISIRQMNVVAWTVCLHNNLLGSRYPECTIVNAFGDHYLTSLCPSNCDVRFYLKTLIEDLTANYRVDVVELESYEFMQFDHGFHHEKNGIDLSPFIKFLLGLCFCDSCTKEAISAGLDITGIRYYVTNLLQEYFQGSRERIPVDLERQESENALDGEFGRFLRMRESIIASLLQEVQSPEEKSSTVKIRPMVYPDGDQNWIGGIDVPAIATLTKEVTALMYLKSVAEVREAVEKCLKVLSGNAQVVVGLQALFPEVTCREELIERVRGCQALGITSFSFYNYGLMRLGNLEWIKEALSVDKGWLTI